MIHITGNRNLKGNLHWIDTTSSAAGDWQSQLSPFLLGPCVIQGNGPNFGFDKRVVSCNMENAWQYSKVYAGYTKPDGSPSAEWWRWAVKGWNNPRAVRYPMGKGIKPLYSFWNGERLGYIEARKKIYCPLYADCVEKTEAFKKLRKMYKQTGILSLFDFDGYNHHAFGMTYREVLNDPTRIMGHAFVLAMMLDKERWWEDD